jgi:hypothetical protein
VAIVKANYVKRGKGCKARAKATIRYITHRRDRDNNKVTRVITGFDGELTKEQAYRMIDEAKRGTIFYRLVISPDPRREDKYKDLSLSDMTLSAIYKLEERLGREVQFVATEHNDHSPHRHTHLLVLVILKRSARRQQTRPASSAACATSSSATNRQGRAPWPKATKTGPRRHTPPSPATPGGGQIRPIRDPSGPWPPTTVLSATFMRSKPSPTAYLLTPAAVPTAASK